MEVTYNNQSFTLGKKQRTIGSEAPAVKIKTLDEQTKVIGMMAPKIQVMVTLSNLDKYTKELDETLKKYPHKLFAYIVTNKSENEIEENLKNYEIDKSLITNDFLQFSQKFGINIDDTLLANSLFIIDKEGEIKYIQIPNDLGNDFNLEEFQTSLHEVVTFKPKGHTHENWMGV